MKRMTSAVKPNATARAVIDAIRYITVATVSSKGEPWSTPVAGYHFDGDYTLYWASWADNQHSKNIRDTGKAFITIYDSTPADAATDGVYMQVEAYEITDQDEAMQAALVFGDDPYNPSDGQ